jgi:DNA-directed RNA polymerase subunit RPC12/RpoP
MKAMLVCSFCGSQNRDPGGEPRLYRCGVCGQQMLMRMQNVPSENNNAFAGAVVGGTLGGVAGGPVGAILGIFVGAVLGNQLKK